MFDFDSPSALLFSSLRYSTSRSSFLLAFLPHPSIFSIGFGFFYFYIHQKKFHFEVENIRESVLFLRIKRIEEIFDLRKVRVSCTRYYNFIWNVCVIRNRSPCVATFLFGNGHTYRTPEMIPCVNKQDGGNPKKRALSRQHRIAKQKYFQVGVLLAWRNRKKIPFPILRFLNIPNFFLIFIFPFPNFFFWEERSGWPDIWSIKKMLALFRRRCETE